MAATIRAKAGFPQLLPAPALAIGTCLPRRSSPFDLEVDSAVKGSAEDETVLGDLPSHGSTDIPGAQPLHPSCGQLPRYYKTWRLITNNNFVLQIVENGYTVQLESTPTQNCPVITNPKSLLKRSALCTQIRRNLSLGSISPVAPSEDQCLQSLYSQEKQWRR